MATSPKLSIVIPAYNEEERIRPSLVRILDFMQTEGVDFEAIVVSDGSTDGTAEAVHSEAKSDPRLRLLTLPRNQGKGAAVKAGALASKGQYVLFSDADLSTDISEVMPFLAAADQGADVVIGSRVLPGSKIVGWNPWYRILSGRTFNRTIRIITLPAISDTQCGFKMFKKAAAAEIFPLAQLPGFGFDVELLFIARRLGYKIVELPITWKNARDSKISLFRHTLPMFLDVLTVRKNAFKGIYGQPRKPTT